MGAENKHLIKQASEGANALYLMKVQDEWCIGESDVPDYHLSVVSMVRTRKSALINLMDECSVLGRTLIQSAIAEAMADEAKMNFTTRDVQNAKSAVKDTEVAIRRMQKELQQKKKMLARAKRNEQVLRFIQAMAYEGLVVEGFAVRYCTANLTYMVTESPVSGMIRDYQEEKDILMAILDNRHELKAVLGDACPDLLRDL